MKVYTIILLVGVLCVSTHPTIFSRKKKKVTHQGSERSSLAPTAKQSEPMRLSPELSDEESDDERGVRNCFDPNMTIIVGRCRDIKYNGEKDTNWCTNKAEKFIFPFDTPKPGFTVVMPCAYSSGACIGSESSNVSYRCLLKDK